MERRLLGGVRIARVPEIVGEIVTDRASKLVAARLGKDLDAAKAELVVLGRKRVRVDPNFANGVFGRIDLPGGTPA